MVPIGSGANNVISKVRFGPLTKAMKRTRDSGTNRLRTEATVLNALRGEHAPALAMPLPAGQGTLSELWMDFVPGEHRFSLDAVSAEALGKALRHVHHQADKSKLPGLSSQTLRQYVESRLIPQLETSRPKSPPSIHAAMREWVGQMSPCGGFAPFMCAGKTTGVRHAFCPNSTKKPNGFACRSGRDFRLMPST